MHFLLVTRFFRPGMRLLHQNLLSLLHAFNYLPVCYEVFIAILSVGCLAFRRFFLLRTDAAGCVGVCSRLAERAFLSLSLS